MWVQGLPCGGVLHLSWLASHQIDLQGNRLPCLKIVPDVEASGRSQCNVTERLLGLYAAWIEPRPHRFACRPSSIDRYREKSDIFDFGDLAQVHL
jgi:hypothetical protein